MGAVSVQSAEATLSAPYSNVPPIGLETASVESLSGYVVRLAAAYAVPASVLAKRAIDSVVASGTHTVVNTTVGRLNGSGEVVGHLSQGVGLLTGRSELHRLSFLALGQRLGVSDRGLLAATRRWCPACWHGDGEHPYERKVWWLGVVDVCPDHRCFLDARCGTCGRLQPALTRGVRLTACSFCGHPLVDGSAPVPLAGGPTAERLLWYATEGARLVHACEVAALLGTDEDQPFLEGYARLAELAASRGLPAVAAGLEDVRRRARPREAQLEELFSALWRLQAGVLELFSMSVRKAVVQLLNFEVGGAQEM